MSDRIAVMEAGRVTQVGSPQAVYERPVNRFVADFIGTSNVLPGRVAGVEAGVLAVRLLTGDVVRVPTRDGLGVGAAVSVVVRPDRMALAPRPGVNALRGTVTKLSYLGTHTQVALEVGRGLELTVHQPVAEVAIPGVGQPAEVTWPVAQSLCFPE